MTYIDEGTLGAKVQTWRPGNPRGLLRNILDQIGGNDRKALLREFTDQVLAAENRPALEAVVEYWFANNLNSLLERDTTMTARQKARAETRRRTAEVRTEIVRRITMVAGTLLLDAMLPHGKTLRESTGAECAAIGGWLAVVGSRVRPDVMVGAVLSEDEVRELFERANGHPPHAV